MHGMQLNLSRTSWHGRMMHPPFRPISRAWPDSVRYLQVTRPWHVRDPCRVVTCYWMMETCMAMAGRTHARTLGRTERTGSVCSCPVGSHACLLALPPCPALAFLVVLWKGVGSQERFECMGTEALFRSPPNFKFFHSLYHINFWTHTWSIKCW